MFLHCRLQHLDFHIEVFGTGEGSIDCGLAQNIGDMIVVWGAEQTLEDIGWFDGILWAQEEVEILVIQLLKSADDPDLCLEGIDDG